jgi:hypothetical protein
MTVSVRKNFLFDENIAQHLEEVAKDAKKSMTAIIQEMIEERYDTIRVKKRLKALKAMDNSAYGLLTDKSIQSIKAEKDV